MAKLTGGLSLVTVLSIATASLPCILAGDKASEAIKMKLPETKRLDLYPYHNYTITVDTSSVPDDVYSSFVLQAHSQLHTLSLVNNSRYCSTTHDIECAVSGSHVGLVQILKGNEWLFPFRVSMECSPGNCSLNSTLPVLIAVTGISINEPIPGGCTLTSNLFIDPNLVLNYTSYSTEVSFQDSDIGFRPSNTSYPVCDSPYDGNSDDYPLQSLEYTVYQKCLGNEQFSVSAMMDAIEDMLTAHMTEKQEKSYSTLTYTDPKKMKFASVPGQGVVYNVIARDKRSNAKTAYVPTITYACDIYSHDWKACRNDAAVINYVIGALFLIFGLGLCFVGHIFFHGEVVSFHFIGGCFLWYLILSVTTSLDHNLLVGLSLLCGILYCLVWFLFWFLTGWHWFQIIAFGLYGDFLITAAILYSPLEDVLTVLQISYVYYLTIICGLILFMVPIVAFPRALSIWTSSLVGSYTFIFGIGMFTYTELSQIVLLVVKKLSIPGLYSAHIDCSLLTTDYVLVAVWVVLLVVGLVIQTTVVQCRRTKHNRRQRTLATNRRARAKFSSFPRPSLLKQLLRYSNKRCSEGEPLLSPSKLRSRRNQWSPARFSGDGQWSPSNSGAYPSNYGATRSTINEPTYK